MIIYGAGMAGLLAANMLRRRTPEVLEKQETLPDNHGALLRFRSKAVQEATGIPFLEVPVLKAMRGNNGQLVSTCSLAEANQYSFKVTGAVEPRSVLDLKAVTRYIAPDNFCAALAAGVSVRLGVPVRPEDIQERTPDSEPAISTIPMPALMALVGWTPMPTFQYRPIWSVAVTLRGLPVRVYQTIYYPGPVATYYRASITGDRLIIEYAQEPAKVEMDLLRVARDFGLPSHLLKIEMPESTIVKRQEYGKLLPMDEQERRRFIVHMSDRYNLYSLGRFATWRQLLLDDVVEDVRHIERFILDRSGYTRSRAGFGLGGK